jgi:hypothetical protein
MQSICHYELLDSEKCMVMARHRSAAVGICGEKSLAAVKCWDVFKVLRVVVKVCEIGGRMGGVVKMKAGVPGEEEGGKAVAGIRESVLWKSEK